MIRSCGAFSKDLTGSRSMLSNPAPAKEECDDLMAFGCLNGLFVLGRQTQKDAFLGFMQESLRFSRPIDWLHRALLGPAAAAASAVGASLRASREIKYSWPREAKATAVPPPLG